MVKKQTISPLLREDFGVEDFVTGAHRVNANALSLEDVALSNALGLLSAFADKADTSTESFAMSAEAYLGESEAIGIMADNVLAGINQRFATGVEISKMGVEGFDPFAYGMEGFGDKVKEFFKMIGAAFKKLIQTVSNFMRQVGNFIASTFAKTQSKYYDNNKGKKWDSSKGDMIKVRKPDLKGGVPDLTRAFLNPVQAYTKQLDAFVSSNSMSFKDLSTTAGGSNAYLFSKEANKKMADGTMSDTVYGKSFGGINIDMTGKTPKLVNMLALTFKAGGKDVKFNEKMKASDVGQKLVFGENRSRETKAGEFLNSLGDVGLKGWLSADALQKMRDYNKIGQSLIKDFNKALNAINKYSNQIMADAKEDWNDKYDDKDKRKSETAKNAKKRNAEYLKGRRAVLREISLYRNIGGKLTGVLLSSYSSLLKVRSYCVTAIKAYNKGGTEKAKKREQEENKAKKNIGLV